MRKALKILGICFGSLAALVLLALGGVFQQVVDAALVMGPEMGLGMTALI